MDVWSIFLFVVGVVAGYYLSRFLNISLTDEGKKALSRGKE
jgi:hypothetical protein